VVGQIMGTSALLCTDRYEQWEDSSEIAGTSMSGNW